MNYLEKLINSKNILHFNEKDSFTESGIYMLYPNFDLEKITNQTYLKVGITDGEKGLSKRLSRHFGKSKVKEIIDKSGKVIKLKGGTVLHRHMYFDKTLGEKFGFNFKNPKSRSDFLKEHCYFKVLTSIELHLKEKDSELTIKKRLRNIESKIEVTLGKKKNIRYCDEVFFEDY